MDIPQSCQEDLQAWLHTIINMNNWTLPPPETPLFTSSRRSPDGALVPLSYSGYVKLVKGWVNKIGLDHRLYGTHSLRATLPVAYYRDTQDTLGTFSMMGHKDLRTTAYYMKQHSAIAPAAPTRAAFDTGIPVEQVSDPTVPLRPPRLTGDYPPGHQALVYGPEIADHPKWNPDNPWPEPKSHFDPDKNDDAEFDIERREGQLGDATASHPIRHDRAWWLWSHDQRRWLRVQAPAPTPPDHPDEGPAEFIVERYMIGPGKDDAMPFSEWLLTTSGQQFTDPGELERGTHNAAEKKETARYDALIKAQQEEADANRINYADINDIPSPRKP